MKHTRLPLIYVPSILLAGFGAGLLLLFLALLAVPLTGCVPDPGPACQDLYLSTNTAIIRLTFATLVGTITLFASSAVAAAFAWRHGRGPGPFGARAESSAVGSTQEPVRQS